MTIENKNVPAGATNTNEDNEQIPERTATQAYLARHGDNTRTTLGTFSGTNLPMNDHIAIIVPIETAQKMFADGPQLVSINTACVEAQSAESRKRQEKRREEDRKRKERLIRAEIEEEFLEELAELDAQHEKLYAQMEAKVEARFRARQQEVDQ